MDLRTWSSGQLANILDIDISSEILEYILSFENTSDVEEYILELDPKTKVTALHVWFT
jgi:hypothetical protein